MIGVWRTIKRLLSLLLDNHCIHHGQWRD